MSYPDQDYYITFLFQRLEAFEALSNATHPPRPGRPNTNFKSKCYTFKRHNELERAGRPRPYEHSAFIVAYGLLISIKYTQTVD